MRAEFSRVSFFTTQGRVFERLTTIRRGLFPRLGQSRVKLISRRLLFGSFLSIDYTDLCILVKREDRTVKIEIESYSILRIEVRRFKKKIRIFVYNIERMRMEK